MYKSISFSVGAVLVGAAAIMGCSSPAPEPAAPEPEPVPQADDGGGAAVSEHSGLSVEKGTWGTSPSGETVEVFTLSNGQGMKAEIRILSKKA